jgi:hypothetical protein
LTPKSQLSVRKDIDIPLLKVTTMCAGYAVRQYDAFNDRELEHKIQLLELPRLGSKQVCRTNAVPLLANETIAVDSASGCEYHGPLS